MAYEGISHPASLFFHPALTPSQLTWSREDQIQLLYLHIRPADPLNSDLLGHFHHFIFIINFNAHQFTLVQLALQPACISQVFLCSFVCILLMMAPGTLIHHTIPSSPHPHSITTSSADNPKIVQLKFLLIEFAIFRRSGHVMCISMWLRSVVCTGAPILGFAHQWMSIEPDTREYGCSEYRGISNEHHPLITSSVHS